MSSAATWDPQRRVFAAIEQSRGALGQVQPLTDMERAQVRDCLERVGVPTQAGGAGRMSGIARKLHRQRIKRLGGKPYGKQPVSVAAPVSERLVAAMIERSGRRFSWGFRSHAEIRRKLGDADPYTSTAGDVEGFVTDKDRFLSRRGAMIVGEQAGQCQPMVRDLLSSDINWDARS